MSTEHLDTGATGDPVGTELTPEPVLESGGTGPTETFVAAPNYASSDHRNLPRESHPHVQKFRLATVLLAIVAVTAVTGAVVFLVNHNKNHTSALASEAATGWSSWHPSNNGNEGVTEIADHVAPYYLQNSTQPLDAVTPISMSESNNAGITTGSGLTVVVNPSTSSTSSSSSNLELLIGKTVAFNICGLGPSNCELAGPASQARMLLLRREALELALYTFKYIPGTQNVIAVLPPGHSVTSSGTAGSAVTVTVLFVRSELAPLLKQPLAKTLSNYPLDVSELSLWSQTSEAELVDELTSEGLFASQVESQQEGGSLLVLSPLTQ